MVVIVAAVAFWTSSRSARNSGKDDSGNTSDVEIGAPLSKFVSIPIPDGLPQSGIVIFAPKNCPSDAAQRAERLTGYLEERGIGFMRSQSANYNNLTSQEEVQRVMAVMNGDIPIVYVNGRAKANPTPEEVEAEYRRSGS